MPRPHEFSAKVKLERWYHAKGRCETCGQKVAAGPEYDHDTPVALGGESTFENCRVACGRCHRLKTSTEDVPRIARAKRQERAHVNARTPRTPMPGGRNSRFKRTMDGRVVDRSTGEEVR